LRIGEAGIALARRESGRAISDLNITVDFEKFDPTIRFGLIELGILGADG